MLKRVVIENYRSCLHTTIDLHPNLSVLIGPNSSGKTNILQAIMLLNKIALEAAVRVNSSDPITVASRIKAVFQHRRTQVALSAALDSYADESNNDVLVKSRQNWKIKGPYGRASGAVALAMARQMAAIPTKTLNQYLEQLVSKPFKRAYGVSYRDFATTPKSAWPDLMRVAEYCMGIRYYGASQFTNPGICPASFQIEQERRRRSLVRTRGHGKMLYNMYSAWKSESGGAYRRYQQFIDIVGPKGLRLIDELTFREVQSSSVDYSVRVGGKIEVRKRNRLLIIPQFRIGRQKLSPNQLSEGTFKTLALLFYVITEDSTAILIEEPEVCVHHGLLSSILEVIKSSSQRKQIVLSTHSDYVLDQVDPDNVYRVAFERHEGTVVRHIPKSMTAKELSALRKYLEEDGNLGDFWREGGLGDRP